MNETVSEAVFPIFAGARALITVKGAQAAEFLNSIITADISALAEAELRPAALLAPQGKILFDFLIAPLSPAQGGGFQLDIKADLAEAFCRRLSLYTLRRQVEISAPQPVMAAASDRESKTAWRDSRFPAASPLWRSYSAASGQNEQKPADLTAWDSLRIAHCLPEGGRDFILGDTFPHDVNYDALGAVSFGKGCYIGQEIVARMQHKTIIRKRLVKIEADEALPAAGAEIIKAGKPIGRLGTVCGKRGLALIRLDRLMETEGIAAAANIALRFAPPPYLPQLLTPPAAEKEAE